MNSLGFKLASYLKVEENLLAEKARAGIPGEPNSCIFSQLRSSGLKILLFLNFDITSSKQ